MKVKEFHIIECEDCKKELKTYEAYMKCFNANHTIRSRGQFTVPVNRP